MNFDVHIFVLFFEKKTIVRKHFFELYRKNEYVILHKNGTQVRTKTDPYHSVKCLVLVAVLRQASQSRNAYKDRYVDPPIKIEARKNTPHNIFRRMWLRRLVVRRRPSSGNSARPCLARHQKICTDFFLFALEKRYFQGREKQRRADENCAALAGKYAGKSSENSNEYFAGGTNLSSKPASQPPVRQGSARFAAQRYKQLPGKPHGCGAD